MSRPPTGPARDLAPGLVAARTVLLVALHALGLHRDAVTVIGAQAVHEHTWRLTLSSTSTVDGDLAVFPHLLAREPRVFDALTAAGFELGNPDRPGIWRTGDPSVMMDLLVPESFAGTGRRAARTPTDQGKNALGRALGIELAVVDRQEMELESFDGNAEPLAVHVAGPAALLCAKAFKLMERIAERDAGRRDRVKPNAGDMLRLMMVSDPHQVRETFDVNRLHPAFGAVVEQGQQFLLTLFRPGGEGPRLAQESFGLELAAADAATIAGAWIGRFEQHA